MKKYYILGLFLGLTLAISPVRAEVLTPQEQYNQALIQLITLLQQQVADLVAQLKVMQASQDTLTTQVAHVNTQVAQVVQNTTPVVAPTPTIDYQNFGSTQVVTPVDKSAIVVTQVYNQGTGTPTDYDGAAGRYPYGSYMFTITVLDKDGNPNGSKVVNGQLVNTVPIVTTFPGDNFGGQTVRNDITNPVGQTTAGYAPMTTGIKTITFTSGGLSTSTTIEVK